MVVESNAYRLLSRSMPLLSAAYIYRAVAVGICAKSA
jgi:hypothetical protein